MDIWEVIQEKVTCHPVYSETQRVGLEPDVWIEPAIEGIADGRDELLEKAIAIIKEE